MFGHVLLVLVLEEGIVQYAVIYVDFTHLWLNALSHALLQTFVFIVVFLPKFVDACALDE